MIFHGDAAMTLMATTAISISICLTVMNMHFWSLPDVLKTKTPYAYKDFSCGKSDFSTSFAGVKLLAILRGGLPPGVETQLRRHL
jgi:hypothetical protein